MNRIRELTYTERVRTDWNIELRIITPIVAAEDFAPEGEAQKESRLESHFPWIHNGVGIETSFDLAHDLQAVPMFFSH